MKVEEARIAVQRLLPDKRYQHTLRVVETAAVLAAKYGEDETKIRLSAMLHDLAKYFSETELAELVKNGPARDHEVLNYHIELWHAAAGAVYARKEFGIENEAVLQGIRSHTTGRKGMSLFEKIIFLADYIEPGRDFTGVDEVRKLAEADLDVAVLKALQNTIQFLASRQQQVYPDTIDAYNDMITTTRRRMNDVE